MNLLSEDIVGSIGKDNYLCKIVWRNGTLIMDEPKEIGGGDRGPDPYSTFLSALAGCTLSTLRMYINRKGWDIPEITVSLNMSQQANENFITFIKREIKFSESISEEQKERLLMIAKKCPVSKILENKIEINTFV